MLHLVKLRQLKKQYYLKLVQSEHLYNQDQCLHDQENLPLPMVSKLYRFLYIMLEIKELKDWIIYTNSFWEQILTLVFVRKLMNEFILLGLIVAFCVSRDFWGYIHVSTSTCKLCIFTYTILLSCHNSVLMVPVVWDEQLPNQYLSGFPKLGDMSFARIVKHISRTHNCMYICTIHLGIIMFITVFILNSLQSKAT